MKCHICDKEEHLAWDEKTQSFLPCMECIVESREEYSYDGEMSDEDIELLGKILG